MEKSTYKNLITVPGAATNLIDDGSTIGGDIVANFKKLADCSTIHGYFNSCVSTYFDISDGTYLLEIWSEKGMYIVVINYSMGELTKTLIYPSDATMPSFSLMGNTLSVFDGSWKGTFVRITPINS